MGATHDRPSLGLLQPIKGAIIAMQWFGGMHGFTRCAPGVTKAFGIATECGMARARTCRMIDDLLRVYVGT